MTEVFCTFDECLYYKPHDECYGVCTKDRIILDEAVSGRTCGCPDAEWDEPQTDAEGIEIEIELEMALKECEARHNGCKNCDMKCAWRDERRE